MIIAIQNLVCRLVTLQLHQAKRGHCVKWRPSTPQVYWHIDIDITFANIVTCVCVRHVMMSCHVMMVWLCVQVFGKMPGAPRTSTQSPEKSLHMHGETTLLGAGTVAACGHEAPCPVSLVIIGRSRFDPRSTACMDHALFDYIYIYAYVSKADLETTCHGKLSRR